MAILRHVADAERRSACGLARAAGSGSPSTRISPPLKRPDAGERLQQFRLAVAGDARDADDLALAQNERNILDAVTPRSSRTARSAHLEHDPAGMRRALVDLEDHLAADHRVGELRRRSLRGLEGRDDLAAPHHRDAIRQAHDLAQLVGDEDDGLVLDFSTRSISNSWSASDGVSTAVGSSSTRISAPRTSAFRISTRCCSPTDNSPTIASGSTSSAYSLPSSRESPADRARAARRARGRPRRRA